MVPISAPRMTPIDCWRVISPTLTIDIAMTAVTELDCIRHVMAVPVAQAPIRLSVTVAIILLSRLPATACIPSDI